jgi:hypothetical protein
MRGLIVIWLTFWVGQVSAQITQPLRWEHELKYTEGTYSLVSMREQGMALVRDLNDYDGDKAKWEVLWLDTVLQQKWSTILLVENNYTFLGYEYTPDNLNLMFRKADIEFLNVQIFDIDLRTQTIRQSKADAKLQVRLTHYTVANGNCVFGGYVGADPVLIIFEPAANRQMIVPGFFLAQSELLDVRPNSNGTFNILMGQRIQGQEKLIFRTFDKRGTILVEDIMAIDEEKTILSAACSVLQHDEVMIGGAFALKNNRQATGLFSCLVNPFIEQPLQYTEFHQLQHFLDYLPDRKARKIKEKATQRETYGREPDYRTNVGVYRIEEFKGGFALFGESFIATTTAANNFYANPYASDIYARHYNFGGMPYGSYPYSGRNPTMINRGITYSTEKRMQQGFALGFDYKGRRLWDYAINMNDFKAFGREQVADFTVHNGVPHFLYKDESTLKFSNHSADSTQISQPVDITIRLNQPTEEARPADNDDGQVRFWYGRYFFVWGVTNIRDSRPQVPNRRVFYVNKIELN